MKISNLKPGDVLWETHSYKRSLGLCQVTIVDVDPEGKWFTASWKGNRAEKYTFVPTNWRRKRPLTFIDDFGRVRLAKRGEK